MTVSAADLHNIERIIFIGQSVTGHQDSSGNWTLAGWEQGLPVHCKPATIDKVVELCNRFEVQYFSAKVLILEFNE